MNTKWQTLIKASFISGLLLIIMIVIGYLFSMPDNTRVWRAILINFLFFTSASAGMVALPAIVIVCHGKWMGSLEKICWMGISFSIPSLITLILLWVGSSKWSPWQVSDKLWLNSSFLFSRNLIMLVLFWAMAIVFLNHRFRKNGSVIAAWFVVIYVLAFTIEGFDMVMSLDPKWYSMMTGGYFFISGLYIATVAWIFLSVLLGSIEKKILHDIGNLALTFCMLTGYLMYCQLLPIWYENLPDETSFLIPRFNLSWKYISYLLLALVYIGPVLLLLNRWLKQNIVFMGMLSLLLFIGMWIERWWLVSAVFEKNIVFGWEEIGITMSFVIVMAVGIALSVRSEHISPYLTVSEL